MSIQPIATPKAPKAIGPYSQAVVAGGLVYCSGQVAFVAGQESAGLMGNTAAEQTVQVLKNLRAVLEAAGSGLDKVVKTTVFLKDLNDFASMNEVYAQAFGDNRPARATVQAARLPKDALVEIDCIALVK